MQTWKLYSKNKMKIRLYKLLVFSVLFLLLIPSMTFSIASPAEEPDLSIKKASVPSEAIEGDEILINVTVENIGGDIPEGTNIDVKLFIDSWDNLVSINSTNEGFSSDTFRYFHLFWIAELGNHKLNIFVDFVDEVPENNRITEYIDVEEGPPLILLNKIEIPENMKVNETAEIKVQVKNVGSFTSQDITTHMKIKEEGTTKIKEKLNGLDRGEIHNFSFFWLPKNFGDYTFNFTVKLDNDIHDQDERNEDVTPFELKWWNGNWHYRKMIGVYGSGNVSQFLNFTKMLNDLNILSKSFEINTIRIIEYSIKGEILKENIDYEFLEDSEFNKVTNAIGNLSWNVISSNQDPVKKYFYVYFDVEENEGIRPPFDETDNIISSYFD